MGYKQLSPLIVGEGGTGLTSTTAYAVICGGTSSTGALQSISSVGTSGQVLTSNGASALPTFQASGSTGNLVLLSSQTASSDAELEFTSLITSSYTTYFLTFSQVTTDSDGVILMEVSDDNGGTYITSGYQSGINAVEYNSTTLSNDNTTSYAFITVNLESTSAVGGAGYAWMYNVGSGTPFLVTGAGSGVHLTGGGNFRFWNIFANNTNTAVNAFRIYGSSGIDFNGVFTLYGLNET